MCPYYMLEHLWLYAQEEWLYQLAILPAMEECSSFSTSLPASAVT
uniref:Uncharacterized protein n=1 Tax=Trichinella nativa TaxID=6335 RepID=A0A0V1KGS7_9BILA